MGCEQNGCYRILLIEDNPADARLVRIALQDGPAPVELQVVEDGVEAWSIMAADASQRQGFKPDLVLMDLNLPRRSGHELLADMACDPRMESVPVVVFSSSSSEEDVQRCYSLGARAYVTKPASLDQFLSVVSRIEQFWLMTARLPGRPQA